MELCSFSYPPVRTGAKVLTSRAEQILNLIVEDYIDRASPIGSATLAREHNLDVSPATVRNEIMELEQEGFVTRPHASAGTVPLDKGYRVYVETVASNDPVRIPPESEASVRTELTDYETDMEAWTNAAAAALAKLVGNAAIATTPRAPETRVRTVRLIPLQDFLSLLVVVFHQARIRKQLVPLSAPADGDELVTVTNRVNEAVEGLTWSEVEALELALPPLEEMLVSATVDMLKEEDRSRTRDHYMDGLRNLFAQPEFLDGETVQLIVEAVESGHLARAILEEAPEKSVIRVVIGGENRGDTLRPLSVVITGYGVPGESVGAIGAVGPMRMRYSRTMAAVRMMSRMMSGRLENVRGV